MKIIQKTPFSKTVRKLNKTQRKDMEQAVSYIIKNPKIGIRKKGDLAYLRIYKFKMAKQLTLLAYQYDKTANILCLLALGSHENFYRDIKR